MNDQTDKLRFDPEIAFEELPERISRVSQISKINIRKNTAGVVLPQSRQAFRETFDAFANGAVKAFESSGMEGAKSDAFYEATWGGAFDRLEQVGYFKKPHNQEGLHRNVFDTQVEGVRLESAWLLKLTFSQEDGIDTALAEHIGAYTAVTSSGVELELTPADVWWYNIDMMQILGALDISEQAVEQVVKTLHNSQTMHHRLLLSFQHDNQPFPMSLLMVTNRMVRRLHPRYSRREEYCIQGPAWDRHKERIVSDPPSLLLNLTMKERPSAGNDAAQELLHSYIWKKEEVEQLCAAREEIQRRLTPLIEQKSTWKTN